MVRLLTLVASSPGDQGAVLPATFSATGCTHYRTQTECPLWVISTQSAVQTPCLVYPRKQTSVWPQSLTDLLSIIAAKPPNDKDGQEDYQTYAAGGED